MIVIERVSHRSDEQKRAQRFTRRRQRHREQIVLYVVRNHPTQRAREDVCRGAVNRSLPHQRTVCRNSSGLSRRFSSDRGRADSSGAAATVKNSAGVGVKLTHEQAFDGQMAGDEATHRRHRVRQIDGTTRLPPEIEQNLMKWGHGNPSSSDVRNISRKSVSLRWNRLDHNTDFENP